MLRTTRAPAAISPLSRRLIGTGPWHWGGIDSLYFHSRGIAHVASSVPANQGWLGRWSEAADGTIELAICGETYRLSFSGVASLDGRWRFEAGGALPDGQLADLDQQVDSMLPHLSVPAGALGESNLTLVSEAAGSGPWRWAGQGPFVFLRGGVLHTPWGNGKWGVERSTAGGGVETAKPGEVRPRREHCWQEAVALIRPETVALIRPRPN